MRRNFFHLMRQLLRVAPCTSVKRLGSCSGLETSRHAPPADRSMTVQPIAGLPGATMIVALLETMPEGLTRRNRRFSRPGTTGMGLPKEALNGWPLWHDWF